MVYLIYIYIYIVMYCSFLCYIPVRQVASLALLRAWLGPGVRASVSKIEDDLTSLSVLARLFEMSFLIGLRARPRLFSW